MSHSADVSDYGTGRRARFRLLRIARDHRITGRLERTDLIVDVPELGITVRMLVTLNGLGVGLQAVPGPLQQPAHRQRTDLMPDPGQLISQTHRRLRGPPQRRLRIPRVPGPTNSSNAGTRS